MYMQCSFCGYLNEYNREYPTSLLSGCKLCQEQFSAGNSVSMMQLLQPNVSTCNRCMRELLITGACTYCTALYAVAPHALLTPLVMFSDVVRAMQFAPTSSNPAVQQNPVPPIYTPPVHPVQSPRQESTLSALWSAMLSPPSIFQRQPMPVLDFAALDLSFLLSDEGGDTNDDGAAGGDEQDDRAPLSQRARTQLLRRPVTVPPEYVCSVCLNAADSSQHLTQLPCDHIFHDTCVNQWFTTRSTCPMCRDRLHRRSSALPQVS